MKTLDHPNIVEYYQTDLSDDYSSFDVLLEYVPGQTLRQLLSNQPLAEADIKFFSRQLLEGLAYLHANGVIHRDLKSANVLITPARDLKLVDFGSSRHFKEDELALTQSLKGSPFWMAPEVALRHGHSYCCDIWSFGCILVESLAGSPPWSEKSWIAGEVLALLRTEGNLPTIPACSPALHELITQCLQRDPDARPSAAALLEMAFFR